MILYYSFIHEIHVCEKEKKIGLILYISRSKLQITRSK